MKLQGRRNALVTVSGDGIGPCISIALSQPPSSRFEWILRVDAETDQGSYTVGRVRVRPPVVDNLPQEFIPKRLDARQVVAYAFCPGAKRWTVAAGAALRPNQAAPLPDLSDASCELFIQSDPAASSLSQPGVALVNSDGRGPTYVPKTIPDVAAGVAPNADQILVCDAPGYLWKVRGSVFVDDEPALTFPPWVLVVDYPGPLPLAAAMVLWSIPCEVVGGGMYTFAEEWPRGIGCRRGITLVVSGGPAAYAAIGTFQSFVLSHEFEAVPPFMST